MKIPEAFSDYFKSLTQTDQQIVLDNLMLLLDHPSTHKSSLSTSSNTPLKCVACSSDHIRADGKYKETQRYSCGHCGKKFSETTGKLTWYLRKKDKLPLYMYYMLSGASIKKCAQEVGIAIQTSFDWRHKLLNAFSEAVPQGFEGIVESDDIFFLESTKGGTPAHRPARKSGDTASKRGISDEQVAVVVTCDRSGNKELKVATKGRISKKDLDNALKDKLKHAEVLCTDSHRSYTAFAKGKPFKHKKFNASKGQKVTEKIYHVQHVNNIASRLRQWMSRFNGVATKYLQNYLNWFMIIERIKNSKERLQQFMTYTQAAGSAWKNWKLGTQSPTI